MPEFLSKSKIIERGWSEIMIKKFLGHHDSEATNPIYKCAAPVKLYLLEKVQNAEQTDDFKEALKKKERRSKKMTEVMDKKRDEILEYVDNLEIEIPLMDINVLYEKACDSYNCFHEWRISYYEKYDETFEYATIYSDKDFLNRISTNYLRHNCTKYEDELEKMFGKVGVHEAHDALQEKINEKILETYPMLTYIKQKGY